MSFFCIVFSDNVFTNKRIWNTSCADYSGSKNCYVMHLGANYNRSDGVTQYLPINSDEYVEGATVIEELVSSNFMPTSKPYQSVNEWTTHYNTNTSYGCFYGKYLFQKDLMLQPGNHKKFCVQLLPKAFMTGLFLLIMLSFLFISGLSCFIEYLGRRKQLKNKERENKLQRKIL